MSGLSVSAGKRQENLGGTGRGEGAISETMVIGLNRQSAGKTKRSGVLLLAHGAPDRLEDIPEFLLHVRSGRRLPDAAVREITRRYEQVGGGSPLLQLTLRQAEALSRVLELPVYVGMRNWKPFISETVSRIREEGVERIVSLCLAPHNSRTSIGLYRKHLEEAVEKIAPCLEVTFIESWHNHPGLIAAFSEKLRTALARAQAEAGGAVPVVFTAHSVPERTVADGDPYAAQVQETARLVAEELGLTDWRLAFQSQGLAAEPWIGPSVESCVDELAARGHRRAVLAPVGFVADHVELLYDIDIVFRDYGRARGIILSRTESLNDSPLFIQALASLLTARLRGG